MYSTECTVHMPTVIFQWKDENNKSNEYREMCTHELRIFFMHLCALSLFISLTSKWTRMEILQFSLLGIRQALKLTEFTSIQWGKRYFCCAFRRTLSTVHHNAYSPRDWVLHNRIVMSLCVCVCISRIAKSNFCIIRRHSSVLHCAQHHTKCHFI